ncbi:MAG: CPBP family intramembrane glutamic endopeptidase [Planctomycetota bacterium]
MKTTQHAALALLLIVPAPSIGVLAAFYVWPGTALGSIIWGASKLWLLLLPLLWHRFVDAEPLIVRRPRLHGWQAGLFSGLAIAAVIAVAGLLVQPLVDADLLRAQLADKGLLQPLVGLGMAAYWVLINSLLEEYVWRWFVLDRCQRLVSGWSAIVLAALCFTLHHVLALAVWLDWPLALLGSTGVFAGGVIWGLLVQRFGSIWPAWISHALADVGIVVAVLLLM